MTDLPLIQLSNPETPLDIEQVQQYNYDQYNSYAHGVGPHIN